jgi:hypothetical protein
LEFNMSDASNVVTKSVTMKFLKSTKGTHVYGADADDAVCSQVYLRRASLPDTPPPTITLSVTFPAGA